MNASKPSLVLAGALVIAMTGCSDWTPIKSANAFQGQAVKIQSGGKETLFEEVVTCDEGGFVIAKQPSDCNGDPSLTFDTRRDKVSIHDKDTKSSVGLVVVGVLTAIFVPAAIVGSTILTGH